MKLVIRPYQNRRSSPIDLNELLIDSDQYPDSLPRLYGELGSPASRELTLRLRIHNQSGIPIIEAESKVEAGQKSITFSKLYALGITAYAHVSEAERHHILQRIWTRRAYGTIDCL